MKSVLFAERKSLVPALFPKSFGSEGGRGRRSRRSLPFSLPADGIDDILIAVKGLERSANISRKLNRIAKNRIERF